MDEIELVLDKNWLILSKFQKELAVSFLRDLAGKLPEIKSLQDIIKTLITGEVTEDDSH